ncbi:MAG: DUF87 domain-containing protein, partial [Candidatus Nanohaloarchaea archaeon]|nr:DUF87 domain-containing protein [Candidatus Nanohaloarchaea archaeon]
MIKFRIPNSPDIQTRFFGQFTAKDIARIGIPVLIGYLTTPIGLAGSVVAGLVIGFVLYRVTVHGKHLDEFTADTVTWAWKVHRNATVDFRQNPEKHGVRTEDGDVLTGHLLVYPVNLSLQNQDEQAALHRRLQDVLETVSYPVKLHIIQDTRSLTQGTIIENNDFDADQLYNAAASYVDTYAESADGHNIAVPVISVPVKKHTGGVWGSLFPWRSGTRTETEQQRILFRRLQEIENALDTAKLETARINWSNFDTAINNKYQDTTPEPFYTDTRGPWMKTVVIEEYPDTVELGWTAEIARCDGEVDITQIVEPADPGTTVKALNRAVEQLSAEISSWINAGYLGTTDLESRLEDAEWMLERFTAGEDLPVKYKAYITARGDTKAACDRVMDQVTTQLDMRQFEYRVPVAETFTVQQTIAPHAGVEEADTDVMPSSSAAAGFPFGTRPFPKSGVVVGEDSRDEAPVLLDRFSWKAPHTVKLGATGSGKSYGTKLELLRSAYFYEDARFIVVDPKKEYRGLVKQIGGHVYEIGSDADRDDI